MNAIAGAFDRARARGRAALIPYIMAGDPDMETSLRIMSALADNGADIIELGIPFSDPIADGPSIQRAAERARAAGAALAGTLDLAARFRRQGGATPLVFMGYANPVAAMGIAQFVQATKAASVDGVLIVDMPFGEDDGLADTLEQNDICPIRLVAPTTGPERLAAIGAAARGFLYYVTRAGVTGAGLADPAKVETGVARVRTAMRGAGSSVPIAVGFGIRTPEQVAALARFCDAVVVGSAVVDIVGTCVAHKRPGDAPGQIGSFIHALADAMAGTRQ